MSRRSTIPIADRILIFTLNSGGRLSGTRRNLLRNHVGHKPWSAASLARPKEVVTVPVLIVDRLVAPSPSQRSYANTTRPAHRPLFRRHYGAFSNDDRFSIACPPFRLRRETATRSPRQNH